MQLVQLALPIQLNAAFFTGLIAATGLAWGIISYWLSKKNTLSLERTRFIFDNLRFFETNESVQTANYIVNGLASDFTIDTFLMVMKARKGTPEQLAKCTAIDIYLNFLWRVAYAHSILKTITIDDLNAFGYYFYQISLHEGLMEYCVREGFEDVVDAIKKLEPIWEKDEVQDAALIAEIKNRAAKKSTKAA